MRELAKQVADEEFVAGKVGEVRMAVLYEKPHTIIAGDYVWRRTDRWINFTSSTEPPVAPAGRRAAVLDA